MGDFPLGLKNQFVCVPHELEVLDFPKLHEDLDLKLYLCNDAENAWEEWHFPQLIELCLGADGTHSHNSFHFHFGSWYPPNNLPSLDIEWHLHLWKDGNEVVGSCPKMEVFLDSNDILKNPNTKFERDQYQLLITQFGEENCV